MRKGTTYTIQIKHCSRSMRARASFTNSTKFCHKGFAAWPKEALHYTPKCLDLRQIINRLPLPNWCTVIGLRVPVLELALRRLLLFRADKLQHGSNELRSFVLFSFLICSRNGSSYQLTNVVVAPVTSNNI